MKNTSLSAPEFSIFTALVEERVGLAYTLADKPIFDSKLLARIIEAGFDSPLDYYYYLRYDDPSGRELAALVQALVVHETFFFRELDALRAALAHFIKPRVDAGERPRLWCAACSTGEEPLTIAMLLKSMGVLGQTEIVASDVSEAALSKARSGQFGTRSLRGACPSFAAPYLEIGARSIAVAPELLAAVRFRQLNLLDAAAVQGMGELDLIVCRNVLIYFRDTTARRVIGQLKAQLKPNAGLLVGVSESLMRFETGLACEEVGRVFVYRKVAS